MSPNRGDRKLGRLRARVARIERGGTPGDPAGRLPTGVAALDTALPEGGLARASVHEVGGAAADGFTAALAAGLAGPVLWCVGQAGADRLYAPGLARFGLGPDRLVVAVCRNRTDCLWAMEEGLRSGALAAVVGEPDGTVDLTASRRLQLAAESGRTTGFVLVRGAVQGRLVPSAVASRWQVTPRPALGRGAGLGWRVRLLRCRGGGTGTWEIDWDETADRFGLAAAAVDRPVEPRRQRRLG